MGQRRATPGRKERHLGEQPIFAGGTRPRTSADLVGCSGAMRTLRDTIARVAPTQATVLLTGASGTGKENAARALHAASGRRAGPFEAVNCGAIPQDLAEAELFGAEAGAYTGATRPRIGRLEAATGGTLFLDEVGDLPLPLQVKLLRALETREIQRLGASRPTQVDFRLVAATNVDLESAVEQGRFRADLYWRLAVVWLDLPPLSARTQDIPALVAHFAQRQKLALHLTPCGHAALARHPWPGNLRELRNLVDRAFALNERLLDGAAIARLMQPRRRPMQSWLQGETSPHQPRPAELAAGLAATGQQLQPTALKALMAEAEAMLIAQALAQSNGTIAASARLLGLKRTTLVEKMRRMGLKAANEAA